MQRHWERFDSTIQRPKYDSRRAVSAFVVLLSTIQKLILPALFVHSFNLNLSSEPSIETLPECSNAIIDGNVINDQMIANFCSDTVRELNNLTEELQHTDLIGRAGNQIIENNIKAINGRNQELSNKEHFVQNRDYTPENYSINSDTNFADDLEPNDMARNVRNAFNGINCDVVDSSPFYTQLSQQLENNLSDLAVDVQRSRAFRQQQPSIFDSVDGTRSEQSNDDNEYPLGEYMLQSVDLRGTEIASLAAHAVRTLTLN